MQYQQAYYEEWLNRLKEIFS
jgi:hypothetical protein